MNVPILLKTNTGHTTFKIWFVALLITCCLGCSPTQTPTESPKPIGSSQQSVEKSKHTNALAKESSPYLLISSYRLAIRVVTGAM